MNASFLISLLCTFFPLTSARVRGVLEVVLSSEECARRSCITDADCGPYCAHCLNVVYPKGTPNFCSGGCTPESTGCVGRSDFKTYCENQVFQFGGMCTQPTCGVPCRVGGQDNDEICKGAEGSVLGGTFGPHGDGCTKCKNGVCSHPYSTKNEDILRFMCGSSCSSDSDCNSTDTDQTCKICGANYTCDSFFNGFCGSRCSSHVDCILSSCSTCGNNVCIKPFPYWIVAPLVAFVASILEIIHIIWKKTRQTQENKDFNEPMSTTSAIPLEPPHLTKDSAENYPSTEDSEPHCNVEVPVAEPVESDVSNGLILAESGSEDRK